MKKIIYIVLCSCFPISSFSQIIRPVIINGLVVTERKEPLPWATIRISSEKNTYQTDVNGKFKIKTSAKDSLTLSVSFTGYQTKSIKIPSNLDLVTITLLVNTQSLSEVIISTGYQQTPIGQTTGSFAVVSNELINRKVSTGILARLEDVTPGLIFNRAGANQSTTKISIRGQSTINSNIEPLIILDNFPYDGDINNINPNDIENITVLKDAAAAAIWGARAGNGVIVITTKKGRYNQAQQVAFNSNVTIGQRPNAFYTPTMSVSDYIETEKRLFTEGFYKSTESSLSHAPLSPVIELLIAKRDGKIAAADADAQIAALKNNDVRNDFEKYIYQKSVAQQYAFSMSGGSAIDKYFVSVGYDKNTDNLVNNGYNRLTLNLNNTYSLLNHKLEITSIFNYTQAVSDQNNPGVSGIYMTSTTGLYPYARLADDQGNPLSIVKDYRTSFIQSAAQQNLLNWQYSPLQEIRSADNNINEKDYRIGMNTNYRITPDLKANVLYQYEQGLTNSQNLYSQDTYFTRDLINRFTIVNADGSLTRPIPLGGIVDANDQTLTSQNFRGQLNYDHHWSTKHQLTALGGYEVRAIHTIGTTSRLYGYDAEHATSAAVNYVSTFTSYANPTSTTNLIPNGDAQADLTDHYISYYGNAAYTYNERYILTGSARFDQSNLFGVKTNQKGVPLWSAGVACMINKENFYHVDWLPTLKLRATYGYNGNIYKTLSAYTTAIYNNGASVVTKLPFATIQNPPNPDLRWERVKVANFGLDFETKGGRINGSVDYYVKQGIDLIGDLPYPPSSGISIFTSNYANTKGQGLDLVLNTVNINGAFKWRTTFLYSHQTDKVTNDQVQAAALNYLQFLSYPFQGRTLYGIYSYQWGGLDPKTGDPQGYVNGVISKDYTAIRAAATPDNITFNGPARPTDFGAFRNTFSYKQLSLSVNISFRLGYYFRKNSIIYGNTYGLGGNGDYDARWQKPGDELNTFVPSVPAAPNTNRDDFYTYSSALVAKGDHIRLQDINLSYELSQKQFLHLPLKHITVYAYANNIGILWRANKFGLDPDYQTGPPVRTISFGLKTEL